MKLKNVFICLIVRIVTYGPFTYMECHVGELARHLLWKLCHETIVFWRNVLYINREDDVYGTLRADAAPLMRKGEASRFASRLLTAEGCRRYGSQP